MTRYLLLLVAILTGAYAAAMWICGQLTDAGIAGAASAAAVLMAEFAAYCQRRSWRAGREQVWARRERYAVDATWMGAEQFDALIQELEDEAAADRRRAVWPHEAGSFE